MSEPSKSPAEQIRAWVEEGERLEREGERCLTCGHEPQLRCVAPFHHEHDYITAAAARTELPRARRALALIAEMRVVDARLHPEYENGWNAAIDDLEKLVAAILRGEEP